MKKEFAKKPGNKDTVLVLSDVALNFLPLLMRIQHLPFLPHRQTSNQHNLGSEQPPVQLNRKPVNLGNTYALYIRQQVNLVVEQLPVED